MLLHSTPTPNPNVELRRKRRKSVFVLISTDAISFPKKIACFLNKLISIPKIRVVQPIRLRDSRPDTIRQWFGSMLCPGAVNQVQFCG